MSLAARLPRPQANSLQRAALELQGLAHSRRSSAGDIRPGEAAPDAASLPAQAVAPGAAVTALPARKSLRAKGFMATLVMLSYLVGSMAYVSVGRSRIDDSIQALQQVSKHEKALALAEASVNGVWVNVNQTGNAAAPEILIPPEVWQPMESCGTLLAALQEFDPAYALLERAIARSYTDLQAAPVHPNWIALAEALGRVAEDLEIRRRNLAERRDELTLAYQRQFDAVTLESLLLSLAGIAGVGILVAWFFARLTGDIGRLESHARQIVHGSRGVVLPVKREDELGRLMHAVNRMAADLDQRERQIELDGERHSHRDKMMALGALAAGLAHEVNNPLAVITGVAQDLSAPHGSVAAGRVAEAARLILAQAQRASQAARNLAELAAPQPTEFDWVDVNAMLGRVVQLMGYDKRYRHIVFESDLASDVPAVQAPGAAVQQVLMQMMSLGCDAMAALPRAARPARVLARQDGDAVEVRLEFPVRLDFTRAEVQRALLLSRAMIEPLGGRLAFDQDETPSLRIKLVWPVDPGSA
ncbi:MAG: HAMP domain-containing protein [Burkholderiaceae bacterium]